MSTARTTVGYEPRFGITQRHFRDFQQVADFGKWIILVRGGKEATLPWIDSGFPAKPLFLKAKVDPTLGLLKLPPPGDSKREDCLFAARHHLCYVVQRAEGPAGTRVPPGTGTGSLVGSSPEHPTHRSFPIDLARWPWTDLLARGVRADDLIDLVLDEISRQPFTSDYDLGAVIPIGQSLDVATAGLARSHQYGFQMNISSPLVEQVAAELNRRMMIPGGNVRTCPRVMHGANVQYQGSPADRDNDTILVFYPGGRVEAFQARSIDDARAVMTAIWSEHGGAPG